MHFNIILWFKSTQINLKNRSKNLQQNNSIENINIYEIEKLNKKLRITVIWLTVTQSYCTQLHM